MIVLRRHDEYRGCLAFQGNVSVEGHVEGEVLISGTVVVAKQGIVRGHISAAVLLNDGIVEGTVVAKEKAHLHASSVLVGSVSTMALMIEPGAYFEGTCEMGGRDDGHPASLSPPVISATPALA